MLRLSSPGGGGEGERINYAVESKTELFSSDSHIIHSLADENCGKVLQLLPSLSLPLCAWDFCLDPRSEK